MACNFSSSCGWLQVQLKDESKLLDVFEADDTEQTADDEMEEDIAGFVAQQIADTCIELRSQHTLDCVAF